MSDMDLELMFPSKYLAAADLNGRKVTVTIKSVTQDELAFTGGKKEKRIVVRFEKGDKLWLMNKTNAFSLGVLLWQSDLGQFRGKRVVLVADEDVIKGETTDCVRVCGSPDATPRGLIEFNSCWSHKDGRKGNKMIERLKRVMAQIKKDGRVAPTPPPAPPVTTAPPETSPPVSPHPEDNPPPPETGGGDFKY